MLGKALTATAVAAMSLTAVTASSQQAEASYSCTVSAAMGSCAYGTSTYVNNEVWNPPPGFTGKLCKAGSATPCQTVKANGPGDWKVTANFKSTSGAVISYPDTQQLYSNPVVDNYSSLTSSYTEVLRGSSKTSVQEAAYDIWFNNWGQEVMVWVDTSPLMRKALDYDTLKASDVSIGGFSYNVYCNGTCPGGEIIVSSNTNRPGSTVDIKGVVRYLEDSKLMRDASTLNAIDFGAEFASTGGAFNTFKLSCYTINENGKGNTCWPTPTPTPTPTVTPSPSATVTPSPTPTDTPSPTTTTPTVTTYSLWPSTATPATASAADNSSAELGVRFTSVVKGEVTGIRFYKGEANTGTHIGHLWAADGTQLASATFTDETASGWQDVKFSTPVDVAANTSYIASYFAPNGGYAFTHGYFYDSYSAHPLYAPADSDATPNGVFTYSPSSTFPKSSYYANNYWVDVDFSTSEPIPTPTPTATPTPTPTPSAKCVAAFGEGCAGGVYPGIPNSNGYNTYIVNQNVGGEPGTTETIYANDPGDWTMISDARPYGYTGVQAFPDVQQLFNNWCGHDWSGCPSPTNTPIDSLTSLKVHYTEESPTGANDYYEYSPDLWLNNYPNDIMFWVDTLGRCNEGAFGGTVLGHAVIDGQNWTVHRYGGAGAEIIFVLDGDGGSGTCAQQHSGTINIKAGVQWLTDQKILTGPPVMGQLNTGWEITSAQHATFRVSEYTIEATPAS